MSWSRGCGWPATAHTTSASVGCSACGRWGWSSPYRSSCSRSIDGADLRYGGLAAALLCSVAVAAPFGMLIGALLPREMEGTLLLLTVVTVQMLIDPAGSGARLTPFWSSREIAT